MKRLVTLAVLALLSQASCRIVPHAGTRRIAIAEGPAWIGVSPDQREGLRLLLEDLAETSGATVMPPPVQDGPAPPGLLLVHLQGSLSGEGLRLQGRLESQGAPDRDVVPTAPDPLRQFNEILAAAGLHSQSGGVIFPADPGRLLPLAAIYAKTLGGGDLDSAAAGEEAEAFAAQEPRCAPVALARAQGLYRQLLTPGRAGLDTQTLCANEFDRALALLPGYPRAARSAGRFFTDTGNQRRALEILFAARQRWPSSLAILSSLAYAARTTGLLPGARVVLRQQDRLVDGLPLADPLTENTYLYDGDWAAFDACLGPGSSERADPTRDFYRGYLRLLRGKPEEALPFFRRAETPLPYSQQFQALATTYRTALEGRREEALLRLRNLARDRQVLRVPDGEFTFKLAEAFAYLGAREEAMDTAQLAFSQGFGCTAWFERAPLLIPLHDLPRWRALITHLQARQLLLEAEFPAKRFGD